MRDARWLGADGGEIHNGTSFENLFAQAEMSQEIGARQTV